MKKDFVNIKLIKVEEKNIEMNLSMLLMHVSQQCYIGQPVYFETPAGRKYKIEEVEIDSAE